MIEAAHLEFALRLHRAVVAGTGCVSPYSVAAALNLLAAGARGTTLAELNTLLTGDRAPAREDGPTPLERLLFAAATLSQADGDAEPPQLSTSAALWADERLALNPAFQAELVTQPNGSVHPADFFGHPECVRGQVNARVARETRELIPELLPPGVPGSGALALLVTALYLRVSWREEFGQARPRDFHAPSGTRAVPTMRAETLFRHAYLDGWRVVGLPASGGVEATVLLPDAPLAAAEPALDGTKLARLLAALHYTRLSLYLPKFALTLNTELRGALTGLGAGTMFTDDADFSGISDFPLAVSAVRHSAVLRVDESGIEGAAATAVIIGPSGPPPAPPPVIRVDRPFLVLVRHIRTGAVYFLGRVTEP